MISTDMNLLKVMAIIWNGGTAYTDSDHLERRHGHLWKEGRYRLTAVSAGREVQQQADSDQLERRQADSDIS